MKRESVMYLISGTLFGVLVGWIIGSQQAGPGAPARSAAPAAASAPAAPPPPPLDTQRAAALQKTAESQPSNAAARADLANLYYDAQQFESAARWYEAALTLTPNDVDVSTDLAFCYYATNQADRALDQTDRSLAIDPKHAKTLLNQGVFRAFGKQDLRGAAESWQKVIDVAPGTEEARRAQQGLDGIKASHSGTTGAGRGGPAPSPSPEGLR